MLVGDHKLGGIATSLSAYESLTLRGYDIDCVVLLQDQTYHNADYLTEVFYKHGVETFSIPPPPERADSEDADHVAMMEYYEVASRQGTVDKVISLLEKKHQSRLDSLQSSAKRADEKIWHPFTQHQLRAPEDIMVIDSANDDFFQISKSGTGTVNVDSTSSQSGRDSSVLEPVFDGSASWWTQGLGHGNVNLTLSAAYAAGRYGHVMFAGAVHEPALAISELLLNNLGNQRLEKVFFSDNGSTGMEVAVKMALRAACDRYGWGKSDNIHILGLSGSYHGDTIGVMNCSEPSVFNEKVDWHRPSGFWFDPPQVKMKEGTWVVEMPAGMGNAASSRTQGFDSLEDVFDLERRENVYDEYIKETLNNLCQTRGIKFGALIIEPVIMGAGGMIFV